MFFSVGGWGFSRKNTTPKIVPIRDLWGPQSQHVSRSTAGTLIKDCLVVIYEKKLNEMNVNVNYFPGICFSSVTPSLSPNNEASLQEAAMDRLCCILCSSEQELQRQRECGTKL